MISARVWLAVLLAAGCTVRKPIVPMKMLRVKVIGTDEQYFGTYNLAAMKAIAKCDERPCEISVVGIVEKKK